MIATAVTPDLVVTIAMNVFAAVAVLCVWGGGLAAALLVAGFWRRGASRSTPVE